MSMKLGQIVATPGDLGKRDAFHVAAVLVKSEYDIVGGDPIRFTDNSFTSVQESLKSNRHGIVDPFLDVVQPGVLFWVILMPDLAHSLHHQFELSITDVPVAEEALPAESDDDREWNCRGCQ